MRHRRSGKKLGRDSAHRRALYSNLAGALIEHGRIKTTQAKAKAVKPFAEQMITLGKTAMVSTPTQVRVAGEIWEARSDEALVVGEEMLVTGVDGLTLQVSRPSRAPR